MVYTASVRNPARFIIILLSLLPAFALAAWNQPTLAFRRTIQLSLEPAKVTGEELGYARFLANGRQKPDGSDIRVMTAGGRPVPFTIVNAGPGDWIELVFNASKGNKDYEVYFAGSPPAETPKAELNRGGLLMESRLYSGEALTSSAEFIATFPRTHNIIGRAMIQRPHLGFNPVGNQTPAITKITGSIFAPMEGTYTFSAAADDRAVVIIDDNTVVTVRHQTGDSRFQGRQQLTRGWHKFTVYHADYGGEFLLTVAWRRPDMDHLDTIPREYFGLLAYAEAGPLQSQDHPLTADFRPTYLGEAFFANNYSHRYKLEGITSFKNPDQVRYGYDVDDGQHGYGAEWEHVFLLPRTYAIKVTTTASGQTDTQTFRLPVDRDNAHLDNPPTDALGLQAKLVARYDIPKMPPDVLSIGIMLELHAMAYDPAASMAASLASRTSHPNRALSQRALADTWTDLQTRGERDNLRKIFAAVPANSDIQPWAAVHLGELLMYQFGEFTQAAKALEPFATSSSDSARRTYGQALLLANRLDEARAILDAMPTAVPRQKQAAVSGAMARTTEFYIQNKDTESAESAWAKWMASFPGEFLEGNSALMRVHIIALRGHGNVAAQVAEAYANANPKSIYAPRLLYEAAKFVGTVDRAKSNALRELLKQRYPEDPLSN